MRISTPLRRKLRLALGTRTTRRRYTKSVDGVKNPAPRVLLE